MAITGKGISEKALMCAISLVFFLSACATPQSAGLKFKKRNPRIVVMPAGVALADTEEAEAVISEINERNRTVEDSQDWIEDAYGALMIRTLESVPRKDYGNYAKYLDDGSVYIIVHPGFFPFFHTSKRFTKYVNRPYPGMNVVEKLLDRRPGSYRHAVLQAQERRLRDFLEFKTTQKKLIVLVMPNDYVRDRGYTYRDELDEYARYLNEVTNGSPSVLLIESKSANRGYLKKKDMEILRKFLTDVNPDSILIGGSYVGRCIESFYVHLTGKFGEDGVFVIPEISAISPRDLDRHLAKALIMPDGDLNIAVATDFLKRDVYNIQREQPNVRNLTR